MSADDLHEDEGWNPEDEKLDKKLLRKQLEIMSEVLSGMREEKEERRKQDMHQHTPVPSGIGIASIVPMSSCQIRMISNGFIIRYLEVKRVFQGGTDGQPTTPAVTIPKVVEAFSHDGPGLTPHIMAATDSMRLLHELDRADGPVAM